MALLKFGDFAVEWSRVYAMRRTAKAGEPEELTLYVDAPHLPSGQPTTPALKPEQIDAAWRQAKGDRRFVLFEHLAFDKARVCAVALNADRSAGSIGFELSPNHGVNLVLPAELIMPILNSVPEPKAGAY
jgi:hypothetical protein